MRAIQTASHWGIYDVMADDKGDLVATLPHARDAHPSPLIQGLPDIVRDKLRIDQPYVREGFLRHRGAARAGRGGDRFVAVSWPQATGLINEELQRIKAEHGNEAIYGGSYGWASAGRLHHAPSVLKRFLGLHGGYVDKLGNHSFGAAAHIAPYVIGRGDIPNLQTPWPVMVEHTRLLVLFGGAHLKNAQIHPGGHPRHDLPDWFERARQAGMEIINISPSRDDVGQHLTTRWLPIRPNTDTALMLALAYTLASENLHDRAFLHRYCEGYRRGAVRADGARGRAARGVRRGRGDGHRGVHGAAPRLPPGRPCAAAGDGDRRRPRCGRRPGRRAPGPRRRAAGPRTAAEPRAAALIGGEEAE